MSVDKTLIGKIMLCSAPGVITRVSLLGPVFEDLPPPPEELLEYPAESEGYTDLPTPPTLLTPGYRVSLSAFLPT